MQLGFIRKQIAARIAPNIDAGERYRAEVRHITGGGTRSVGVNIYVTRERVAAGARAGRAARARKRADVQRALLGDRPLRDAQRAVLERMRAGRNTLAVLGTGARQIAVLPVAGGDRARSSAARRRSCSTRCARWPTISTKRWSGGSNRSACASSAPTARSTPASAPR